jgi:hypothetical protein
VFGTLVALSTGEITLQPRAALEGESKMDATKLVEEYEAKHAKDDYTSDLELLFSSLIDDETTSITELYSQRWAARQTAFLASC